MKKLILASKSPRRKEILQNLNIEFDIMESRADESIVDKSLSPDVYVVNLASIKAVSVAKDILLKRLVVGADTVVAIDGKILGKPNTELEARQMLMLLSEKKHSVFTGICVLDSLSGKMSATYEKTDVYFKKLTDEEIDLYIKSGEPMDKAGGYAIQGLGSLFIKKIDGDYFNVVGLPVFKLAKILKEEFCFNIL